ncbi:MAG TPA: hypothetical protein VGG38_12085 [Acidimicrobiales bacterium]
MHAAEHRTADARREQLLRWVPGLVTVLVIGGVIAVTLWQLHVHWLFTNTTVTGGDTGAHVYNAKYLQTLLKHGHLAGWDPGWYDGYSLYTFYFALPDLFAAVAGWIIPFNIAFKLVTILGSLLLPICAWACGRLFRLRAPIPTVLAAFTLPFLFDYTFTIYGGNLFSTMAGEYAFSFSLSMAILFLGLFARAIREGRGRVWASIVLALCLLSHIVPAMYALAGAAVLAVIELMPARFGLGDDRSSLLWRLDHRAHAKRAGPGQVIWRAVVTVGVGILLSGWWLVPFGLRQGYATNMDYQNLHNFVGLFFPGADMWALVLAGLAVITSILIKSRFGLTIAIIGTASALGLILDPQGSLYNVRLLPLWIVSFYLLAAWMVGTIFVAVAALWRSQRTKLWKEATDRPAWDVGTVTISSEEGEPALEGATIGSDLRRMFTPRSKPSARWSPGAIGGAVLGMLAALIVVVPPFIAPLDSLLPVTLGPNELTNWSSYDYEGYQNQPDYAEYKGLISTMERLGHSDGCGRAMWEYSSNEDRFGTPEALMLLPYWTNNCIDSMEGLLFESSATTPYHFINQAELSAGPSEPEVGLPYGPLDVVLGVQHLQLLGVKYFIAETATVEAEADADPSLKLVATSGPWQTNYGGANLDTLWKIYEVKQANVVTPLANDPAVVNGIHPSSSPTAPTSWLTRSLSWYIHPARWTVELAQSGPASWPRVSLGDTRPPAQHQAHTVVSHVSQGLSSISFNVSKVGVPVLVKISYFPNWHATGATGPYRVTPNLMVVVPTSHQVSLVYGSSPANKLGDICSLLGLLALVGMAAIWWRRRRAPSRDGTVTPAGTAYPRPEGPAYPLPAPAPASG